MNWQLDINVLVTLLSIASVAGMGWMRLSTLERDLERIEKEVVDTRELRAEIALVKAQLSSINHTLEKLANRLETINNENYHK